MKDVNLQIIQGNDFDYEILQLITLFVACRPPGGPNARNQTEDIVIEYSSSRKILFVASLHVEIQHVVFERKDFNYLVQ